VVEFQSIKFCDAYNLASSVWSLFVEHPEEYELEEFFAPQNSILRGMFATPHRWTLLHYFIDGFYRKEHQEFEHDRNDMLNLIVREYEAILKGYEIAYKDFELPSEMDAKYDNKMQKRISYLRSLLPYKRIANDTFQLLFGDREFLLRFSQVVAEVVLKLKFADHPNILQRDGVINRAQLPIWAKRGVFYRDRGRCINCGKDLTGSFVTGEEVHYDHILPLINGGTNDPTNFQILCRKCNLKKARNTHTSDKYPVYWKMGKME
jgi:hypothetical protein